MPPCLLRTYTQRYIYIWEYMCVCMYVLCVRMEISRREPGSRRAGGGRRRRRSPLAAFLAWRLKICLNEVAPHNPRMQTTALTAQCAPRTSTQPAPYPSPHGRLTSHSSLGPESEGNGKLISLRLRFRRAARPPLRPAASEIKNKTCK